MEAQPMSLRALLSLLVALALVALAVASWAILGTVRASATENLQRLEDGGAAATSSLARAYERLPLELATLPWAEREPALRRVVARVLEPVIDTRGGYCFPGGTLVQEDSGSMRGGPDGDRGPPPPPRHGGPPGGDDDDGPPWGPPPPHNGPPPTHGGPPGDDDGDGSPPPHGPPPAHDGPPRTRVGSPPPPPPIRAAIERACSRVARGAGERVRVESGGMLTLIVVEGLDGAAAFTTRDLRRPRDGERWPRSSSQVLLMALLTMAMVGTALAIMRALRGGAHDVDAALARLEHDLRSETPRPSSREFAAIADRLRHMAHRLADAQDRERGLQRRMAHQARLSALGRAVAGVAHEIRNPLAGIKLLLDRMQRRGAGSAADDVRDCLHEIQRLDNVVGTFLGVARDPRTPEQAIDAGSLVDERLALQSPAARARQVTLRRSGEAALQAERPQLVQVVDNLVRNAIEASPPGGSVDVRLSQDEREVQLAVVDRGPGVPARIAAELFEPFVSGKEGGTGLGLWLSATLATSRGGELRYDRAGDETRFLLRWPRVPADEPTERPDRR
jgi:signal transduction histidine kinase